MKLMLQERGIHKSFQTFETLIRIIAGPYKKKNFKHFIFIF